MIPPLQQGRILGSPETKFVVMEVLAPERHSAPPRHLVPLHVHHRDDEAIYVLEGVLTIQTGDEVSTTAAGSGVYIPSQTPHTFWNAGDAPVRFLVVMEPRIFLLIQELNLLPGRAPEDVANVYKKCESSLLEPFGDAETGRAEVPSIR